jgi:hypothetical protein
MHRALTSALFGTVAADTACADVVDDGAQLSGSCGPLYSEQLL